MTTCYTLTEHDAQELLERISWRPLAYMNPSREEKRKADVLAIKLSMVDVWPGGQVKWCSALPTFDNVDVPTPTEERSKSAAARV